MPRDGREGICWARSGLSVVQDQPGGGGDVGGGGRLRGESEGRGYFVPKSVATAHCWAGKKVLAFCVRAVGLVQDDAYECASAPLFEDCANVARRRPVVMLILSLSYCRSREVI